MKTARHPFSIFICYNRHYEKIGNNPPVCIDDELPFEIPDSWSWTRFSAVGNLKSGYAFKSSEYVKSGIQIVRISDLGDNEIYQKNAVYYPPAKELSDYLVTKGSFLICQTGSIGKMAWVTDDKVRYLNQRVGMYIPTEMCNKSYLWAFLHTQYVLDLWISAKTSTNGNIKNSDILDLYLPLPPLAEQERIVAEIEKYEPLIAEYDKLEQEKSKLDGEIYNKLKKSILQYAIQGKLVPQEPTDEPASVLLEKIRAEKKAKLGKKYVDSFIYKGDDNCYYEHIDGVAEDKLVEVPFDLPDGWVWTKIGNIANVTKLAGFEYTKYIAPNIQSQGVPLVKGKNIQDSEIIYNFESYISEQVSDMLPRSQVTKKCILTPYVGIRSITFISSL